MLQYKQISLQVDTTFDECQTENFIIPVTTYSDIRAYTRYSQSGG